MIESWAVANQKGMVELGQLLRNPFNLGEMMSPQTNSRWLVLLLALYAWSSGAETRDGRLPSLPNCAAMKSSAVRVQALDHYVTALEDWTDKTPDFMERSEAHTYVTLVAAHLLPEATPFRRYEQECWVFFEDARRALADGKTQSAKQSARAWDTCLAMRQDGLRAAAKPFMRCLR